MHRFPYNTNGHQFFIWYFILPQCTPQYQSLSHYVVYGEIKIHCGHPIFTIQIETKLNYFFFFFGKRLAIEFVQMDSKVRNILIQACND